MVNISLRNCSYYIWKSHWGITWFRTESNNCHLNVTIRFFQMLPLKKPFSRIQKELKENTTEYTHTCIWWNRQIKIRKHEKLSVEVILLNSYPVTVVKILKVRKWSYGAITQTAQDLYSFFLPIVLSHNNVIVFAKSYLLFLVKKISKTFFSTENCYAPEEKEQSDLRCYNCHYSRCNFGSGIK